MKLNEILAERILVLDGAMGTMIQRHKLQESDYRGERFANEKILQKGNNDLLILSQPEIIYNIHCAYLEAGADIIETNTFNAQSVSMEDYGMGHLVHELNIKGAQLARKAADKYSALTPDKPRFVAGALGPTNRSASLSPDVNDPGYRAVNFDKLVDDQYNYIASWISAFINAHVDIVKDPYISKMNINQFTYNMSNLLIRSGFGESALWFLS